jgi:hypothetical protein
MLLQQRQMPVKKLFDVGQRKIKDINIFNTVGFYIKGKKQWLNLSVIQLSDRVYNVTFPT